MCRINQGCAWVSWSVAAMAIAGAAISMATGPAPSAPETPKPADAYSHLPAKLALNAVIRDVKGRSEEGGHPDFEFYGNTYVRMGLLKDTLDAEGKPSVLSLQGTDIRKSYLDASGQIIYPAQFDPARGDRKGELASCDDNMITSEASFASWYRDTRGVNLTKVIPLVLERQPGTDRYVFDSAIHEPYKTLGGFFPIDGDLFGNFAGWNHNFHFTTEVRTTFLFKRGTGQVFKFTGDDDVWVFVDGKLVLDLGGLHPKREMFLELDRLDWLENGGVYPLVVFHAERHTRESNFRIETSILLRAVEPPPAEGLAD